MVSVLSTQLVHYMGSSLVCVLLCYIENAQHNQLSGFIRLKSSGAIVVIYEAYAQG